MSQASAGRMAAAKDAEESPGSTETRCRITSGGGNPRESATEKKPPYGSGREARVKWCGKSAPRAWRHGRHGKPHREQDRIGATRGVHSFGKKASGPSPDRRPGWLLEAAGNGRPRGMAVTRTGTSCAIQNPAYRPAGVFATRYGTTRGSYVAAPLGSCRSEEVIVFARKFRIQPGPARELSQLRNGSIARHHLGMLRHCRSIV